MELTKEELDQKLLDELRSHGGEEAAELGQAFLKMDADEKLVTVTVLGLRSAIHTIDKADIMILSMTLNYLMKEEPMMCVLLCTTLNEAIKGMIEEKREKLNNGKEEEDEQESN